MDSGFGLFFFWSFLSFFTVPCSVIFFKKSSFFHLFFAADDYINIWWLCIQSHLQRLIYRLNGNKNFTLFAANKSSANPSYRNAGFQTTLFLFYSCFSKFFFHFSIHFSLSPSPCLPFYVLVLCSIWFSIPFLQILFACSRKFLSFLSSFCYSGRVVFI